MTSKLLFSAFGRADNTLLGSGVNRQMRYFFAYLRVAFNKVDTNRLEEVGPDQLCAEWVIKNGGAVQFANQKQATNEYNAIQMGSSAPGHIKVVDGSNSSIMALGFEHFKGCKDIERIILNQCKHMENAALEQLVYVKNTLKELQVTNCPNVVESGLLSLKQLNHLQKLTIYDLFMSKISTVLLTNSGKTCPNVKLLLKSNNFASQFDKIISLRIF